MVLKIGYFEKEGQKYLGSFEMRYWRKTERIIWAARVKNPRSITKSRGGKNILHTIKKGKVNWIGHILRRNCLLKHAIKGKK